MELNITHYLEANYPHLLSNSVTNLGSDVRRRTWNNCIAASDGNLLTTEKMHQDVREWFLEFSPWNESEINSWTQTGLEAIVLQFVAEEINRLIDVYKSDNEYDESMSLAEIIQFIDDDPHYNSLIACTYSRGGKIYMYVGM